MNISNIHRQLIENMERFLQKDIEIVKEWMQSKPPITIITHFNPDGDAIGSSMALKLFLEKQGLKVDCIFPSAFPSYYNWIPKVSEALVFNEKEKVSFGKYFDEDRIIFCLDFNHPSRVNQLSESLANSKAKRILIDHHEEPSPEFEMSFSYPGTSSTCELVYDFMMKFDPGALDKDIATCLYTGLLTDTGGFQFSSTHPSTLHMAANLMEMGINATEVYNLAFNNFSINRLKLFGYCISNNMTIVEDKKLAYMWIDRRTKDKFHIQDGDTEGLVNYPMKVLDIEVSVLFKQDYDKIRISFRSKNDTDVNKISRQYFNGGGHINAAGGMSKKSLKETLEYFESLIPSIF